jgi:hypothetical protein
MPRDPRTAPSLQPLLRRRVGFVIVGIAILAQKAPPGRRGDLSHLVD